MSKIVAFAGSPRENGRTWRLLREVIRGAEAKGGQVTVYNLNDPGFHGCQGCFHCRTHPGCPVNDNLSPFYREVHEVAGIVVTSPIYFGYVSGQAKMWLDRMFPMLEGTAFTPRHPGKKVVTIFSQGEANPDSFAAAIKSFTGFMHAFGWTLQESLMCPDTSNPGFQMPEELMRRAYAVGEELAG